MELPTERQQVTDYNPSLMVLFGKPKSGKSTIAAALDNALIIDLEDGYRSLPVMRVKARSAKDLLEIKKAVVQKAKELGKFPYKYIVLDNATRLEEMALPVAADL
jgi:predicted kinase